MKCERVRELLPAYVDRDLHAVGEIETHLASCEDCRAELDAYRSLLADLASMRADDFEPSPEFLVKALELIPPALGDRARKTRIAIASIGGAAVGATALAIVLWRLSHRGVRAAASASASASASQQETLTVA